MALRNVANSENMVITENLSVSWSRKIITLVSPGRLAREYTRRRVMNYEYVGITQSAAKSIAQQIENWLVRRVAPQTWNGGWGFDVPAVTVDNTGGTVVIAERCLRFLEEVVAGHATPVYLQGSAWKVVVNIDEILTYKHPPSELTPDNPPTWPEFERDPSIVTGNFKRHTDGITGGGEIDFPLFKDWSEL